MEPWRAEGAPTGRRPGEAGNLARLARWVRSRAPAPRTSAAALGRWEALLSEVPAEPAVPALARSLRVGPEPVWEPALAALARLVAPDRPGLEASRALVLAADLLAGGLVGPAGHHERLVASTLAACAAALAGEAVDVLAADEEEATAAEEVVGGAMAALGAEGLRVRVTTLREAALRDLEERADRASHRGRLGREALRFREPGRRVPAAPSRTLLLDADRALLDEACSRVVLPTRRADGALGVQGRERLGALLAARAGLAGFTDAPRAVRGELLQELGLPTRIAPAAPPGAPWHLEVVADDAAPSWVDRWCAEGGAGPAVIAVAPALADPLGGLEELRARGPLVVPAPELPGVLRRLRARGAAPRALVVGAGGPPHLDSRVRGALAGAGSLTRLARLSELCGTASPVLPGALLARLGRWHASSAGRHVAGALLRRSLARSARLEAARRRAAARAEARLARSLAFAGPPP